MPRLGSEELEWFVQSAPVALLVLDLEGAVTAANASAAALIGEPVEAIYGRSAADLFDSVDGERLRELLLVLGDVTERVRRERARETVEHAQAFLAAGAVERFRRGSTLVMYTDGLVERRGEPVDQSLDQLAALAAAASADPRRLVDHVVERLRGATSPDDVAVFAIHSRPGEGS